LKNEIGVLNLLHNYKSSFKYFLIFFNCSYDNQTTKILVFENYQNDILDVFNLKNNPIINQVNRKHQIVREVGYFYSKLYSSLRFTYNSLVILNRDTVYFITFSNKINSDEKNRSSCQVIKI